MDVMNVFIKQKNSRVLSILCCFCIYLLNINFEKDSSIWYGKVTRKGKKGYSITNNSDTRNYFMKRLEKE